MADLTLENFINYVAYQIESVYDTQPSYGKPSFEKKTSFDRKFLSMNKSKSQMRQDRVDKEFGAEEPFDVLLPKSNPFDILTLANLRSYFRFHEDKSEYIKDTGSLVEELQFRFGLLEIIEPAFSEQRFAENTNISEPYGYFEFTNYFRDFTFGFITMDFQYAAAAFGSRLEKADQRVNGIEIQKVIPNIIKSASGIGFGSFKVNGWKNDSKVEQTRLNRRAYLDHLLG